MTKLKNIRIEKNFTQADVAKAAGITLRSYQYYEAGEQKPSVDIAIKIARKLETTVEELFFID